MISKISIIYGFGIAINAFLTLLLLFKKNKAVADKILFVWLCFALIHQTLNYMEMFGVYQTHFTFLVGVDIPLPLTQGPFLFLYVSQLTDISFLEKNKKNIILHFIPAIICYIYMFKFFSLPIEKKLYIMSHEGIGYEEFVSVKFIAIIVSGVFYVTLSLIKIKQHQKKIKDVFSNTEKINLQWLKILTFGMGIIWIVVLFGNHTLTFVAISFYISTIGFFGIKQVLVFSTIPSKLESIANAQNTAILAPIKHESFKLPDIKKDILEKKLKQEIDENKLFLNSNLTLDTLASKIDIHPNYVSQYINEHLALTFYDYINSKRIAEFKRRVKLPESKNLNLLGIAYDCGFNSKSTFNRNFKKITGQTPSEYLNTTNNTGVN